MTTKTQDDDTALNGLITSYHMTEDIQPDIILDGNLKKSKIGTEKKSRIIQPAKRKLAPGC